MHDSSMELMRMIFERLAPEPGQTVLDVGSLDVNGTYRPLCEGLGLAYTGCDQDHGPNVEVIWAAEFLPWEEDSLFDIVISGQMLEHTEFPLQAAQGMKRAVKPGGWLVLQTPWCTPLHRYPIDCWRILSDGMRVLLEGFTDIVVDMPNPKDCYGYGRKPEDYKEPWLIRRT